MISESKMSVDYPGYVYGGLVAMGGVMGYVKRQDIYTVSRSHLKEFLSLRSLIQFQSLNNNQSLPLTCETSLYSFLFGHIDSRIGLYLPFFIREREKRDLKGHGH